jgi:hypothetical protein
VDDEAPPAAIAVALRIRADAAVAFFSWQAWVAAAAGAMPGFLSIEFIPAAGSGRDLADGAAIPRSAEP